MEKITLTKIATETKANYTEVHEVQSYADVSDGYHTIEELYDHRITLYIALCRVLAESFLGAENGGVFAVWRTKLHYDGTGYDGWFMLAIGREPGSQITYHVPLSRWTETDFAETFDKAPVAFDGHSSADVLKRLALL